MRLPNLFRRHRKPAAVMPSHEVPAVPGEPQPLPEQRADLQAARVELRQAMEESDVTSFRACSRNGRHWAEDPDAMRAMAALFRSVKEQTVESPEAGPAR